MAAVQRIQYHRYGGPEVMRLEEFEPREPGRGQVLVRIVAAAANPVDWAIRQGRVRFLTGRRFPRGLGHDFAGVVERVGPGVTRFRPGDPVFGGMALRSSGAFAEMGVALEKYIARKPPELSFARAASIPTAGVTALQAVVDKGRIRAGGSVFVTGCMGAVGRTATEIALRRGASVAGSARAETMGEARALGVDPVVGFDTDPARIGRRFDLVLDTAGVLSKQTAHALLEPAGRVIDINPSPAKVARSVLPGRFSLLIGVWNPGELEELARGAVHGELGFPVARTVPLAQAIEALTELERHRTPKGGKLVVTMGPTDLVD